MLRAGPMSPGGAEGVRARPYTAADRSACLAVFDSNVPDFFTRAERAELEAFLDDLPGPYLVLEAPDGDVVGCGGWAVEPLTDRADLCWGMVRRDLHGRGLGRRLAELRIAAVREAGAASVVALSTSHHTKGFYERLGFETVRVVEDGFAPGLHRCDMLLELDRGG